MRWGNKVIFISLFFFMVGCNQPRQVKVTYISDPPGGTLCKQNGEVWGPCPKTLWYDLNENIVKDGNIYVNGLSVRWPDGLESRSDGLIRITVNGTDRQVIFNKPKTSGIVKNLYYRRY